MLRLFFVVAALILYGLYAMPTQDAYNANVIPPADTSRCMLPSVEAGYQELQVTYCVNYNRPATDYEKDTGNYAPDCSSMRVTYVPCYPGEGQ